MAGPRNPKTLSDELFERYLREHGFDRFEYEPKLPSSDKAPDYKVGIDTKPAYFEVKQFDPSPVMDGAFDPYAPIREKINVAARQLRPLKGGVCAVVLANPFGAPVVINRPFVVMGAMLGDAGIAMPVNVGLGKADPSRAVQTFLSRGKMANRGRRNVTIQNRTVSALCVLDELPIGVRKFSIEVARRKLDDPKGSVESLIANLLAEFEANAALEGRHLRMVSHENPYAVAQLPSEFGTGPWDERWAIQGDGSLDRSYVGPALKALEDEQQLIEDQTR